ncbi:MAG: SCO family protein [Halioglobus sp.]|nr:SCO family protein [Halioglobus sp.]
MSQSRNIKLTVAGLLLVIAVIVGGFVHRVSLPRVMTESEMKINGLYLFETPRDIGEFALVDHRGEVFDPARLEGHWSLVFFGFTHCPDICPTTMTFLNQFVSSLEGTEAQDTQVVMVSVDPARDTVQQLASYVPFFNPDFTGVTGEFLDIHRFATALNTPFRKVTGEDDNYQVEHSANVALINPRGDYAGFFKSPLDLAKMKVTYRSARYLWDH